MMSKEYIVLDRMEIVYSYHLPGFITIVIFSLTLSQVFMWMEYKKKALVDIFGQVQMIMNIYEEVVCV